MFNSTASLWLGVTFVLIGAINVWLILQASARVRDAKAGTRLIAAHRIGGYLFIALFCVMGYYMLARLADVDGGAQPISLVHMTLAMVLSPLLFVKVLIARYYRSYYSFLMPIGLAIFVLSFVLIGITAGPSLAHRGNVQIVSLSAIDLPSAAIDIDKAASTMEKRCSKCHNLDRIAGAHKDARGWLSTVNRMKALPDSGISEEDARLVVSYLTSQMGPKRPGSAASLEVQRAIVDQRCGRCHGLDRVYKSVQEPEEWQATVARMVQIAEGSGNAIQPGEDEQIIAYLSATQTPDAVNRRKAASAGRSAVAQKGTASFVQTNAPPARTTRYQPRTVGFIAFVFLSMVTLVVRRPSRGPVAKTTSPSLNPVSSPSSPAGPLILRLVSITPQASDAKTLRFIVPDGRKVDARPGQFLTFSFLFDGKKVRRSYSICSSAARSGYVEITTKRVRQGCASVFLNDRASVGMTVEANGPFGRFCFDESKHRNVVLLAAGSGITPMMAMLRYMDDLCLETSATLLYCVRSSTDIIFESELERLRANLKSFEYRVLLSQPPAEWSGPRGHISREFVENAVADIALNDFFLCGPLSFMEAARTILIGLGVQPERIMQESFGSSAPSSAQAVPADTGPGVMVEFARSGKTCTVRGGRTLLEAAEEYGIGIPSSCRQGQCGTCKTKLLAGNVRMDAEEGLDPDSRAQGFVLTCVGRADGDVTLDA